MVFSLLKVLNEDFRFYNTCGNTRRKKTVLLAWKRRHHPNRYFSLVINVEIERDIKMTITAVARGQKCVTGKNAD